MGEGDHRNQELGESPPRGRPGNKRLMTSSAEVTMAKACSRPFRNTSHSTDRCPKTRKDKAAKSKEGSPRPPLKDRKDGPRRVDFRVAQSEATDAESEAETPVESEGEKSESGSEDSDSDSPTVRHCQVTNDKGHFRFDPKKARVEKTMYVCGKINGQQVIMLVDTGADRTFITQGLATKLKLKVIPADLTVVDANKGRVAAAGQAEAEICLVPDSSHKVAMVILPQDDCMVYIGMDYLQLAEASINFKYFWLKQNGVMCTLARRARRTEVPDCYDHNGNKFRLFRRESRAEMDPENKEWRCTYKAAETAVVKPNETKLFRVEGNYQGAARPVLIAQAHHYSTESALLLVPEALGRTDSACVMITNCESKPISVNKGDLLCYGYEIDGIADIPVRPEVCASTAQLRRLATAQEPETPCPSPDEPEPDWSQLKIGGVADSERAELIGLLREYQHLLVWDKTKLKLANVKPITIDLIDESSPVYTQPYNKSSFEHEEQGRQVELNDCSDGSDEIDCQNITVSSTTSTPTTTACSRFQCNNGKCVNLSFVCDGDNDCGDLSDERNCRPCRRPLFSCENRNCLIEDHVCDGDDDCGDGTDERNCPSRVDVTTSAPTTRKMENTFCSARLRCSNGKCLRKGDICDGTNDCGDYSDEADCGRPNACRKGVEFQCAHTLKCVPYLQRCDYVDDCGDNSDETGCEHALRKSNYSSNWFFHGLNKQTFESAIAYCESNGASLPVVASLEEQQWLLTSITKGRPFWLFLKKDQVSGEFSRWGNGEKVKFTNWQANREANSSQCTAISVSRMGKWLECSCHSWRDAYVICMRDRPLVAQDSITSTSDDDWSGTGWLVTAAILCAVLLALIIYVNCEIRGFRTSVETQIVTDVETNIEMKAYPDEEMYYSSPSGMINYYASSH
ncbi:Low-density lipoprotein receptor-related protein 2 [Halotydeus destructor]|nr:Low-density lipoprotein receptor-related protein 2 [Halotydeus destructor]